MTLRTLNYWNYGTSLIMGHAGFISSTVLAVSGFAVARTDEGIVNPENFISSKFRFQGLRFRVKLLDQGKNSGEPHPNPNLSPHPPPSETNQCRNQTGTGTPNPRPPKQNYELRNLEDLHKTKTPLQPLHKSSKLK